MQQQRTPNPDRSEQILHLHKHEVQKMRTGYAYGFLSSGALIMAIAMIPQYAGIIPGALIFFCGAVFGILVIKLIEGEE